VRRAAHSRIVYRATPPIAAAYNPSSCTQNLTQKTIKIIIVPRPRRKKQRAEKICMKFPSVGGGGAATLAFCVLFALVCVLVCACDESLLERAQVYKESGKVMLATKK
jgi:hypothetical protein